MIYLGDKAVGIAVKYDYSIKDIAEGGAEAFPEYLQLPNNVTNIGRNAFESKTFKSISGEGVRTIDAYAFAQINNRRYSGLTIDFPNLEETGVYAFAYCDFGGVGVTTNVIKSNGSQFERAYNLPWLKYTRANSIGADEVWNVSSITKIIINSTPNYISEKAFRQASNLTDIYVPWSEGEVANAPWGATNATIHYNTVFDENGEVTPNA